jgi:8-oxo-dGTP pyrophosphatase MutT (NUDIX family)
MHLLVTAPSLTRSCVDTKMNERSALHVLSVLYFHRGGAKGTILMDECARDARGGIGAIAAAFAANGGGSIDLNSGLQVLVGQAEVVNLLRSEEGQQPRMMRYPGEFRLPGGATEDADGSLAETARRELSEEFLVPRAALEGSVLRPFSALQTRWIRGRSDMMCNFLVLAEENPWLARLDVEATNHELGRRELNAADLVTSGRWWRMSDDEKAASSPEVHQVAWLDLIDLVRMLQTSVADRLHPVNAWQHQQFSDHGVARRDPMSVTMAILLAVDRAVGTGSSSVPFVGGHPQHHPPPGSDAEIAEQMATLVDAASVRFSENIQSVATAAGNDSISDEAGSDDGGGGGSGGGDGGGDGGRSGDGYEGGDEDVDGGRGVDGDGDGDAGGGGDWDRDGDGDGKVLAKEAAVAPPANLLFTGQRCRL